MNFRPCGGLKRRKLKRLAYRTAQVRTKEAICAYTGWECASLGDHGVALLITYRIRESEAEVQPRALGSWRYLLDGMHRVWLHGFRRLRLISSHPPFLRIDDQLRRATRPQQVVYRGSRRVCRTPTRCSDYRGLGTIEGHLGCLSPLVPLPPLSGSEFVCMCELLGFRQPNMMTSDWLRYRIHG